LFRIVKEASVAVNAGRCIVGALEHLADDLAEMAIDSQTEFWNLLPALLQELEKAGPSGCYRGWRPDPERSGEEEVRGLKLWAFAWNSQTLGCEVYLKFCLKGTKTGEMQYAHVRLHQNRRSS
jgi:hypothetical protein